MYLSDLINERQLKKTFTQFSAITQAISPNVQREQCANFIGAIRYQLFGKMNAFVQLLTEPLFINSVQTEVEGFEFLRQEWTYYKFEIKRDDWDYSLYLGCFNINGHLRLMLFQKNADYTVYGQMLFFNAEHALMRFMSFSLKLNDANKIFPKEGTNHLILDDSFAFCWKKHFKDLLSFETLLSSSLVKEKIIIDKPLEEKENVPDVT